MSHARVLARVKADNGGAYLTLPVILYELEGRVVVLEPLLRYFTTYYLSRSRAWMIKCAQAVGLLLDYVDANHTCFDGAAQLFAAFSRAMTVGTLGEDGIDPSGLYWTPKLTKGANDYLIQLSTFSDWMVKNGYTGTRLNPWTTATTYEQRLSWAALVHKSEKCFLGHLNNMSGLTELAVKARAAKLRRRQTGGRGSAKSFPAEYEFPLLREGFIVPGKEASTDLVEKYDWRGICITLLLLGGARRVSEPFHLWVCDVVENPDPRRRGEALVRFYHPVDGEAPTDVLAANGRPHPNRQAYLQARYAGYVPRIYGVGNYEAGWKGIKLDDEDAQYFQVKWLPREHGQLFLTAFQMYMQKRLRLGILTDKHPFLFVSTHPSAFGEPYTIAAFEEAWKRALNRIGLKVRKSLGTSLHGGRHSYGRKARSGGVTTIGLKSGFGHRSIESQEVYGEPSIEQVTREMDAASDRIAMLAEARIAGRTVSASMPASLVDELWLQKNRDDAVKK